MAANIFFRYILFINVNDDENRNNNSNVYFSRVIAELYVEGAITHQSVFDFMFVIAS